MSDGSIRRRVRVVKEVTVTLPSLYDENGEGVLLPSLYLVGGVFVPKGGVAIGEGPDGNEYLAFPVHSDVLKEGLYSFPWPGWEAVQIDGVRALREFIGITDAESARAFGERYGPLYECVHHHDCYWQGEPPSGLQGQKHEWRPVESVRRWLLAVSQVRAVLKVATALQEGSDLTHGDVADATCGIGASDVAGVAVRLAMLMASQGPTSAEAAFLKAHIDGFRDGFRDGVAAAATETGREALSLALEGFAEEVVPASSRGVCVHELSSVLTNKLRRFGVVVTVSSTLPFQPEFFTGLGILPVLWQQLAAVIGGGRSLAICSVCGLPYVRRQRAPRRGANNYCSECSGSGGRQRLHRRRKRGPLAHATD